MRRWKKFITRYGSHFCALALVVSTVVSENCHICFYQPEEPEGLEAFAKRAKKTK